jgi:hypothetical protein
MLFTGLQINYRVRFTRVRLTGVLVTEVSITGVMVTGVRFTGSGSPGHFHWVRVTGVRAIVFKTTG